jgi:hypothetical protein
MRPELRADHGREDRVRDEIALAVGAEEIGDPVDHRVVFVDEHEGRLVPVEAGNAREERPLALEVRWLADGRRLCVLLHHHVVGIEGIKSFEDLAALDVGGCPSSGLYPR